MPPLHAFFHATGTAPGDQRLYILHAPPRGVACVGQVLYVPPFAEEMNKSRRMAALQSRALAEAGFRVLQIDLAGCGDSSGDFGDASWEAWVDDVRRARAWLASQGDEPLWFWGLRAGCLLAAEAASRDGGPSRFLFWQPVASGKLLLQQFLRLRVAAEMLGGAAKGVMDEMKAELAAGRPVELAGYLLPAGVADGLARAVLAPPADVERVVCLELSTRGDAELSPATANALAPWRAAGHAVDAAVVEGPSFWQTTEIEEAPRLIDASVKALAAGAA